VDRRDVSTPFPLAGQLIVHHLTMRIDNFFLEWSCQWRHVEGDPKNN
jgi:hypothetical protein